MKLLIISIIAYLLGSFSSAYVVGKLYKNIDIREHGSGNAGATNAMRVLGKPAGIVTFVLDALKSIVSVVIGLQLYGYYGGLVAAIFTVIGHNWPLFFGFKGGKGIVATITTMAILQFKLTLISVIIGLIVGVITKYVSLLSITFLISLIVITFTGLISVDIYTKLTILFLSLMGIYRHRSNIKRLINGKENKFGGKSSER
ncbi:glycerol-3-phosphate 1-O-acyltransferase PlsY [Soehngenia longivitae]|uniref:Glycerol-3-phosphate acyltransferase n=1 Tax=Soehngenia longivitae TaxID=2562294 RepID=A0A4Z0D557_9FIRM|nr:glycerol-3-phosphate 1-O-acyltransferase PlsY [Soehngenia longivitae]TFZ39553.1 glycerol-3-phosphate 1-O-acyltransferase PlsY [Soehngenia longivitae]